MERKDHSEFSGPKASLSAIIFEARTFAIHMLTDEIMDLQRLMMAFGACCYISTTCSGDDQDPGSLRISKGRQARSYVLQLGVALAHLRFPSLGMCFDDHGLI
jgi:hypothetical protein